MKKTLLFLALLLTSCMQNPQQPAVVYQTLNLSTDSVGVTCVADTDGGQGNIGALPTKMAFPVGDDIKFTCTYQDRERICLVKPTTVELEKKDGFQEFLNKLSGKTTPTTRTFYPSNITINFSTEDRDFCVYAD